MSAPCPPVAMEASRARTSRAGASASASAGAGAGARPGRCVPARGFSLIVAMLMLAIIGLASAAIMRNATSAEQVAANNRLQTQANQFAQAALRFCENQLTLAPALRSVPLFPAASPAAWTPSADWTAGGAHMAHTLVATDLAGTVAPAVAPQCMVEATALANVFTVTARGFSPDFTAAANGVTRGGAVVWLQSTLLTQASEEGAARAGAAATGGEGVASCADGACALTIRQRLWQQLLTPPF